MRNYTRNLLIRLIVAALVTAQCIPVFGSEAAGGIILEKNVSDTNAYISESVSLDEAADVFMGLEGSGIDTEDNLDALGAMDDATILDRGTFGDNDSLIWVLDSNHNLIITGTGDMPDFSARVGEGNTSPWGKYVKVIRKVKITGDITSIGDGAFKGCTSLKSVSSKGILTSLGSASFYQCQKLAQLALFGSFTKIDDYTFYNCNSLSQLSIPSTVDTMGFYAFGYCSSIEKIYCKGADQAQFSGKVNSTGNSLVNPTDDTIWSTIWDNSSTPPYWAAYDYVEPEEIIDDEDKTGMCGEDVYWKLERNAERDGYNLFILPGDSGTKMDYTVAGARREGDRLPWEEFRYEIKRITIQDGITLVCDSAFEGMTELAEAYMSDSVIYVDSSAFADCTALNTVQLSSGLKYLGRNCFNGDTSLIFIQLPGSIIPGSGSTDAEKYTFSYLFKGCSNLSYVILPESFPEFPEAMFDGCESLKDIYYAGNEEEWSILMESRGEFNDILLDCKIHYKDVSPIGDDAEGTDRGTCGSSLRWNISGTGSALALNILGTGSMYDYNYLADKWGGFKDRIIRIVIQKGATRIGSSAFHDFPNLTSVTIPATVTEIDDYAFYGCKKLAEIDMPEGVLRVGKFAFSSDTNLRIVSFPKSITDLDRYAFNPSGPVTINYAGSEDDWKNISIDSTALPEIKTVNYLGNVEKIVPLPTTFVAGQKYDILNNHFKDVANAEYFKINGKKVAKIDKQGILKAKKPGYAVVYAMGTDENGRSYAISSCEIRVVKKPKLVFNRSFTSVSDQFSAYDYIKDPSSRTVSADRWDSSDPSVATVDEHTGLVSISGQGITVISAAYGEDLPLIIKRRIKVQFPALKTEFLDVSTGKSKKIKIKYIKKNDRVQYTSLSSNIASAANGKVTGRSPGTTTVTVSVNGVEIGSCEVNVY